MARTHRIFISHSWNYSDTYERLIELLQKAPNFDFVDYSVPRSDPIHTRGTDRELYDAIRRKVALCHVVVIMAGVYATHSKWIAKEIKIAGTEFSVPKPIVGVRPWASTRVSDVVRRASVEMVGWNTNSIVAAIQRYSTA